MNNKRKMKKKKKKKKKVGVTRANTKMQNGSMMALAYQLRPVQTFLVVVLQHPG
jgi:hypothetical protein